MSPLQRIAAAAAALALLGPAQALARKSTATKPATTTLATTASTTTTPAFPLRNGRIQVGLNGDWPLTQAWASPALASARATLAATTEAAMGASLTRTPLYWRNVQPTKAATPNWFPWDQIVNAYSAAGIKVILNISAAPNWARNLPDGSCGSTCQNVAPTDDHLPDLRAFVASVAKRYGTKLAGIEIYNEPNLATYWQVNPVDPARYTRVLCAGYQGVQDAATAIGAKLPVGGGALAVTPASDGTNMSLADFLHGMMVAGAAKCMDAISFHPYPFSTFLGTGSLFANSFKTVRAQRDAYAPGMRLWVTETGLKTGVGQFTDDQQATTLRQIDWGIEGQAQRDVDMVLYHTLVTPGYGITTAVTDSAGIVSLVPKPAYTLLKQEFNPVP